MTAREWKPGDVALVTCKTPPLEFTASRDPKGWNSIDPSIGFAPDNDVVDARPLLLIDPEDREQVERLHNAVMDRNGERRISRNHLTFDDTQAALRSLIALPKPEEPTGLGAVVFASCECKPERRRFVRDDISGVHPEAPWKQDCGHHAWADLSLRDEHDLLGEGVPA